MHDAVRLLSEIVDALSHAHGRGVVHRDIKPDNVMLSGRHALVMDFGVAKAVSEATGRQQLTTAGVALGTPAYMAPEQATADPHLDHRVDIYAVGALAYELLAGRPPFTAATPQQVLAAHVTQAPEPISTLPAEYLARARGDRDEVSRQAAGGSVADRRRAAGPARAPRRRPAAGSRPTTTRPLPATTAAAPGVPRWVGWMLGGALVAGGALALSLTQRAPSALVIGRRVAVAASPAWEGWPSLSPDGKTITYTTTDPRTSTLFVQQIDGGSPIRLGDPARGWSAAAQVSPDGTRILYLAPDGLYLMPALGGQARLVAGGDADNVEILWGAWSPDGKRIAYPQHDTLFVQALDGARRVALASGTGHPLAGLVARRPLDRLRRGQPDVSLQREHGLVRDPSRLRPRAERWVRSSRATRSTRAPCGYRKSARCCSSLIARAAGTSTRSFFGTTARRPARLSASPPGSIPDRLGISADGERLAWSVYTETTNAWSIPIPARDSVPLSQGQQITTGTQNIEAVAVSRDGAWLYVDSDRGGNMDLWRQALTGGAPQQLTTDSTNEFSSGALARRPRAGLPLVPRGSPLGFRHACRRRPSRPRSRPAPATTGCLAGRPTGSHWSGPMSARRTARSGSRTGKGTARGNRRLGLTRRGAGSRMWMPDGKGISFVTDSGINLLDIRDGARRLIISRSRPTLVSLGQRRQGLFGTVVDSLGRLRILSAAVNGKPKVRVYADHPLEQQYRYGFAMHGGRVYIPIVDRKADVWVAELEGR